jgi:hypothetical protein
VLPIHTGAHVSPGEDESMALPAAQVGRHRQAMENPASRALA